MKQDSIDERLQEPLLVSAATTARLMDTNVAHVYELAAKGLLGKKAYIGTGTKNFRLHYSAVKSYIDNLPEYPMPATG